MALSNFYTSKKWVDFMAVLRLERTNADGDIICEHCGKPIVRAYDCIGHHIEELTEENVDDVMIALNPDNIMLVHHRCHNKIHDKLGLSGGTKQVYLVYGSPLSGKSTWVDSVRADGDLVIDIDSIWQCISGCDRYVKPNRLKSVVFTIRDSLLDCVRYRKGNWLNAYVIGGYPLISERQQLCKMLGAREVYIESSIEECMQRLDECSDGRDKEEWAKYIDKWWELYRPPIS